MVSTHLKNMIVKLDPFPRDRGENKDCLKPPSFERKGFPGLKGNVRPLRPICRWNHPALSLSLAAGQLRKQRVKGKCWVQSPFRLGGRAPSRKSTRKNIHQKIIKQWVYLLGEFFHFTWFFEGESLNTAVGAGPSIPSGPSLDFLGLSRAYRWS